MASRAHRRPAAALGLVALGLGGAALVHPGAVGAAANRPGVFSGAAAAAALHEEDNGQAGFAVYEPVYGSFAEGATTYTNDGQSARASTFWPGPTFGNTGSLICQLSCAPVPAYPLSVQTEGPPSGPPTVSQQTSTQVGGSGQPASASAASATASADPDTGVSTDAVDGGFAAPGTSASASSASVTSVSAGGRLAAASAWFHRQVAILLHQPAGAPSSAASAGSADGSTSGAVVAVRSMTASTSQRFVGATLVADADTELSGVSLLAGMVDIASIKTASHARSDGATVHTHSDDVTASGVTVAGVPATIGAGGISVSGQGAGSALLNSVNAALHQALAAAGADVTLVGATSKPPQPLGGCSGDQADGVFVHTTANAQSAPVVGDIYNGDYTLGSTCASAEVSAPATSQASAPAAFVPSGETSSGGSPVGQSAPAGSLVGVAPSAAAPASLPAPGSGALVAPPAAARASSGAGSGAPALATLGPFIARRFATLYWSVVGALATLLLGVALHARRSRLAYHPRGDDG